VLRLQGDDALVSFGASDDTVFHHHSLGASANAVISGVTFGSPRTFFMRANELVISNVVESGGISIFVRVAGNSYSVFHADAAGGSTYINAHANQAVSINVDTTEEYNFNATRADFNGNHIDNVGYIILNAVTLPASSEVYIGHDNTGDLTLNAKSGKSVLIAIAGTDEYAFDATAMALGTNNITMTGAIATTGSRVSHIYTTSQTTTNAWTETRQGASSSESEQSLSTNPSLPRMVTMARTMGRVRG
jgi:hypothetical protein